MHTYHIHIYIYTIIYTCVVCVCLHAGAHQLFTCGHTVGLGSYRLRWYDSGYDSYVYFLLPPSPTNTTGTNMTEESSAVPPRDPLLARTTASSLASISDRENDSSEAKPPSSAGTATVEVSPGPEDNHSTTDGTGWQRPHWRRVEGN